MSSALLLALHLSTTVATAHPFSSELYGQQLVVDLDAERLAVDYLVEVPAREAVSWLAEARRAEPHVSLEQLEARVIADHLDELEGGLRLEVDGEPSGWTRGVPVADSGVGDERFVAFRLRLEAELPPGPAALQLSNGNHPDTPTLFQVELWVDDSVVIDESTLYEVDGERVLDETGGWHADEELREIALSWRGRGSVGTWVHRELRRLGRPVWLGPELTEMPGVAVLSARGWPRSVGLAGVRPEVVVASSLLLAGLLLGFVGGRTLGQREHGRTLLVVALCVAVSPGPLAGIIGPPALGLLAAACLPLAIDVLARASLGPGAAGIGLAGVSLAACLALAASGWVVLGATLALALWAGSVVGARSFEGDVRGPVWLPTAAAGLIALLGLTGAILGLWLPANS